ncbi:MAG: hypothetical protein M3N53_13455 [Actinomycetota bacterium]|nr:hypothetical protein [Actinomycetota bacterium]
MRPPRLHAALETWLAQVRRRVRVRRGLLWMTAGAVAWGGAGAGVMLLARVRPLGWEEEVVLVSLPLALMVPFLAGALQKLPSELVARAADRDLAAADRLGTAVEFAGGDGAALAAHQAADAARYAIAHDPRRAAPLRVPHRRIWMAAGLAAAVALLAFVENPMDAVLERQAAERKLLEQAAQDVERGAREVDAAPIAEEQKRELVEELDQLARELRDAASIEEALKELLQAQRRLAAMQDGDHIATKTLTSSFERSLENDPLAPGLSGSAQEQLRELAAKMDQLGAGERNAAAERLQQLAESVQAMDPELAAALAAASTALSDGGDPEALADAASALAATLGAIAAQESVAASAASLGALGDQLAAAQAALAQAGQGQGQAAGEGEGAGAGQGQGQGQGQGAGGQNQGTGVGAGGAAGTNANSATGATGGAAQPDGTGRNASKPSDDAPIFDPIFGDEIAERLRVGGNNQGGRDTELGTQIGAGRDGHILIPYSYVYPEWSARAARTVDTLAIPASLRSFVRAYFRSLAPKETS